MNRYCTACWRNARLHRCWTVALKRCFHVSWNESHRTRDRLLKDEGEGEERREFLRAIDTVKKRTQRSRTWSSQPIETVADRRQQTVHRLADDLDAVRQASAEVLSDRQRRIIQLSLEGWTVQDVAAKLRVPAERVSDEKYKAIRKLKDRLADSSTASRRAS